MARRENTGHYEKRYPDKEPQKKQSLLMHLNRTRNTKAFRAFASALAVIVVFGTTYSLILPAITVDHESAEEMPGFYLEDEAFNGADYENAYEDEAFNGADYENAYEDEAFYSEDDVDASEDANDTEDDSYDQEEYVSEGSWDEDELTVQDDPSYDNTWDDEENPDSYNDPDHFTYDETSQSSDDAVEITEDDEEIVEEPSYTYNNTRLETTVPVTTDFLGDVTFRIDYNGEADIPDGSTLHAEEIDTWAETEEERVYKTWRLENLENEAANLLSESDPDWSYHDAVYFDTELTDPEGNVKEPVSQIYLTLYFTNPIYTEKANVVQFHYDEQLDREVAEFLNPVDYGYTEDGGIYAFVLRTDELPTLGVICGDSLQTLYEQDEEEQISEAEEYDENEMLPDDLNESETDVVESETEFLPIEDEIETSVEAASKESETESMADPILTESETESMAEPVLTESETESAAEPVLTESETESMAEPILTESETESMAEPVLTESETESIAEPVLEIAEVYPAQDFEGSTDKVSVKVYAPEGAFPAGTMMTVKDADDNVINDIAEAVSDDSTKVQKVHAVDITFTNKEGNEIEPLVPVRMTIASEKTKKAEDALVVHVSDEGNVEQVEQAVITERNGEAKARLTVEGSGSGDEANTDSGAEAVVDADSGAEEVLGYTVEADAFSVYAIVYTVDFHWEVDGKTYDLSIPGGGFISFSELMEVLGVAKTGENEDVYLPGEVPGINNLDVNGENQGESGGKNVESSPENAESEENSDVENHTEVPGINTQDVSALTLDGEVVSEKTREFVADVESVVFSAPELVDVSKVENETTVGGIKESRELNVQYSAELTEEQIEEINSTVVESGDWALISMLPFDTEETLTVTMKTGEVFEIIVTDAQLKKTIKTAKGETWEITITYDDSADIPKDAELKVEEILSEDEKYDEYYQQSLEKIGVVTVPDTTEDEAASEVIEEAAETASNTETATTGYAHIFDIQIWAGDQQIEPASDVAVSIKLLDAPEDTNLQVVHFSKDGPEVIELAENNEDPKDGRTELNFVTDEFSVYTVVNVDNNTDLVNGGPWTLVTGIANDPGATTGYSEKWGTDYFTIIVNAHAMSDKAVLYNNSAVAYDAVPVHAWTDGTNSYVGGEVPQVWYFERSSTNNNKYNIYVLKDGQKYYIDHHYGNRETTSLSTQWKAEFTIERNSDGTISLNSNGWYLCNNGDGEWSDRDFRFQQNVQGQARAKFRLCKESDAFDSFAARKVSVQNLTPNDSFLIYRKFEDSQGNEQLYALASDGTFVRVYDGGDTLYWRETDKNIYWKYRMEGGYYQIYSTLPGSTDPVYINPMYSEPSQTITSEPAGLTLIGRSNGEYGSALENWDQKAYDYAGLHVTVNDGTASLSAGTRVAGTSDEFLFAVASNMPAAAAETVDTVDSDSLGIKITMFDYGQAKGNYSAGDKLSEMTAVAGSDDYTPHAAHALVKPYLESGLPSNTTNGAMTGLFTGNGSAVTAFKENVNHLFLQSYYDENGMFRYRSEDNYAYLPYDADTQTITGTDFTVYRQAATPYPYDVSPGHTYYTHGHFMPYNDIDMTNYVARLMNQYGNEYTNGNIVGELPVEDGRTYEYIYGTQGIPNFYTGMKMEANFTQPKGGKLDNGDDMIFKFTGDDDMWVYIDGVLVLDIGGIHEPLSGTINFATGKVTNPTGSSLAGEKTLKEIFDAAEAALNSISNRTPEQNAQLEKIQSIQWTSKGTFADYTNHDFKTFYMERGAGASNLDIQFNLKVILTNQFVVEKQIPDSVDKRFVNQEYKFQATYKDGETEKPLYAGISGVCSAVVYKDKEDDQGNPVNVPVDNQGYFTLKAGEAAIFKMENQEIEYSVKEVEIDSNKTEQVEINGQAVTVSNGTVGAAYARVADRTQLNIRNYPVLQNLNIIKHLLPEGTQAGSGDVFEFRVYLESTVEVDGQTVQQLVPYSYGPYFVTKTEGGVTTYYTLTGENNAPEPAGTDPVVCSTTGRSGSINSIPPEYTVVIPNLAVGTHFYIEERRDNIPAGYTFDHETLVRDEQYDYDEQTLGTDQDIISRILARDEKDSQVFDHDTIGKIKNGKDAKSEIFNRKLNVKVQKQWLRTNGQPYTLEQARQLPGSTGAVITAELWRKKIVPDTSGETEAPVTVTFMVNTSADSTYMPVSQPVTVKSGSTLEFSLGARGTSQPQEIHSEPSHTITRSSVTSNPKIEYSNGRQKDSWSKFTISDIEANTIVYATFDASKVGDDFVGLYIASMEAPGSDVVPVEEKVADVTLNNDNDWLEQYPAEPGYTYFLTNVSETGLADNAHRYTFVADPAVTTDAEGNITLAVANKYHESINITVEKIWSPKLTSDQENSAYVMVELHRYAKKTKGVLEVVLKDQYGAPIEGAVFKLYKDDAAQEKEYTTNVNGKVTANNLEPGSYYFKQISTPQGYSMSNSSPQSNILEVKDNQTVPQELHDTLTNQALETNGVATLTLLDNTGVPIQGATYELRRSTTEEVIKSGLATDENGQVTVSQLKAGTYYFFELETPDDYIMPLTWQDTAFTVREQPGAVQTFDIHMTNNLKGKGVITVSLTGPAAPISGATFELYKASTTGTEKVAEGTTNGSGNLTFGNDAKLSAGTYYVRQVTTDADLLPTAAPVGATIADNGDVNQVKEVSFTNPYRGKGSVTVTLTRKDNNNPISGATFELYKDGVLFETKTTDSNGQVTFGSPGKLDIGNYIIKQTSTADDLETVVDQTFQILENGNPNQHNDLALQNDKSNVYYSLRILSQSDNLSYGPHYFKSGTVVTVEFDNNNPYYNPYDGYQLSGDITGTIGMYPNSRVFTVTMDSDKTVTVLKTGNSDFGNVVTNAVKLSPDPEQYTPASMQNSLLNSSSINRLTSLLRGNVLLNVSSDQSAGFSDRDFADIESETYSNNNVILTRSAGVSVLANGTASATVNPSGPPSGDYIVDSVFVRSYRIEKKDDWKHVFEDLDKYDLSDNLYYYYVVETECNPNTYHVASYGNDNLTDTGTITITNTLNVGSVKVTKAFSGIDSLPDGFKITASYTVDSTSHSVDLTTSTIGMTGSGTEADPYTWTISDLPLDTVVTFTESGYEKTGYTVTTSPEGVNDVVSTTATVVLEPTTANGGVASFTNTYTQKTVNIPVNKTWAFATDSGITKVEEKDWPQGVTVHVVLYSKTGDNAPSATTNTVDLTADKSSDTFTGLPEYDGEDKIDYSVVEAGVTGIDSNVFNTVVEGNATDGYTIRNTEKEAGLTIIKAFEGATLTDAEKNAITFTVTGSGLKDRNNNGNSVTSLTRTYAEFTNGQWVLNQRDGIVANGTYTVTETSANVQKYTRVSTVKVNNGDATTFTQDGTNTDAAGNTPTGQITMSGTNGTVTITNTYTKEKTEVSGSKTWVDTREHNNAAEITLKLYRKVEGADDSTYAEVHSDEYNFTWDGNTYTFSGLDKNVSNDDDPMTTDDEKEYVYKVEEVSVNVTEAGTTDSGTTDSGTTDSGTTVSYKKEADGNNFTNTELTDIEATKTWKQGNDPVNATITNASVTFELQRKSGENWSKVEQDELTNPVTITVEDTPSETAWKATWNQLPKYEIVDEGTSQTVAEIEYRVVETAATVLTDDVKPETNPTVEVSDGTVNIDNTLPDTGISVTKQWKDGSESHADKEFAEDRTITFTLYQKLGDAAGTVYTPYGNNGKGTVTYTAATKIWGTTEITGLPKYVLDTATNTWTKASYYVVEDSISGVAITYKKGDGETAQAAESSVVTADDTARNITIVNEDMVTSIKVVKVDQNNQTTKLDGAKFELYKKQTNGTQYVKYLKAAFPESPYETSSELTITDKDAGITFTGLTEGEYQLKETKSPDGYVLTGNAVIDFKVTNGVISNEAGEQSFIVQYDVAADTTPATYTIGNTPGAALPNTGGPGTRLFTILGSILILGAGLLLWWRRRLI